MKTSKVTALHLSRSVVAAPPLARSGNLSLNIDHNRKLVRHIERGGVSTLLYGANANLYNLPLAEYGPLLDQLEEAAGSDSWIIPGAGPDYGRLMDQAALLRQHAFPAVLVLPGAHSYTREGVEQGLRHFADTVGAPLLLGLVSEDYLRLGQLAALNEDGLLAAVVYAIPRVSSAEDPYLGELLDALPAKRVISGHGDATAAVHMRQFGLPGFSSGGACIAPALANALRGALRDCDEVRAAELAAHLAPLEALRRELGPARVLHEAVSATGIADMGPPLPLLSAVNAEQRRRVDACAQALLETELTVRKSL